MIYNTKQYKAHQELALVSKRLASAVTAKIHFAQGEAVPAPTDITMLLRRMEEILKKFNK